MNSLLISLGVGISSSLLATALFILVSEFFRKKILPWYADKIYRGVRIDGEWEVAEILGNNLKDLDKCMTLALKQNGDEIRGFYSHKDGDEIDEYIVQGRIRDMYFLATAIPKSNRLVDGITILLQINTTKSKLNMTGGILYQSHPSGVESTLGIEFQWKKS